MVHKRANYSDFEIIENKEVDPAEFLMKGYLGFTNSNAYYAKGRLHVLRGKVEFDHLFQSPPDVWLRMTSSGIDTEVVFDKHYYDPYDKALKITNVEEYGFSFELYYWKVDYYSTGLVDTQDIPDVYNGDVHLDYTAIGQETSQAVCSEYATISGPTSLNVGESGTWTLDVSVPSCETSGFSYEWYLKSDDPQASGYYGPLSYSDTYSTQMYDFDNYLSLKVYVTKGSEFSLLDRHHVFCNDCGIGGGGGMLSVQTSPSSVGDPTRQVKAHPDSTMSDTSFYAKHAMEQSVENMGPKKMQAPDDFNLSPNYPNPFNPSTTIKYGLPERAEVTVNVYNILGQNVATLVNETQAAGRYTARFDAGRLASGLYIARVIAKGVSGQQFIRELKMQLIK